MREAFANEDDDRLRHLLGLRPWECSPLDYELGEECKHPPETAEARSWPKAQALRKELEACEPIMERRSGVIDRFEKFGQSQFGVAAKTFCYPARG
jgi:hypothetical protein